MKRVLVAILAVLLVLPANAFADAAQSPRGSRSASPGGKLIRNMLIGAAVGAGVGLLIGSAGDCGRCGADRAKGVLGAAMYGAMIGAAPIIRALDLKGLPLGEARFAFKADDRETDAEINLPVEIRNDIARLEISGERSAGAVQLLDKRWRRRTVGVVSGSTADAMMGGSSPLAS